MRCSYFFSYSDEVLTKCPFALTNPFAAPVENAKLFAAIFVVEVGLRELLIERLAAAYGNRWAQTALPGGDIQSKIREAREYERRTPWVSYVPLHPVYYLDFPDLITIIERRNNWDHVFRNIFDRKDIIISTLRQLEPLRNKVAHNRRATIADLREVEAAVFSIDGMLARDGQPLSLQSYAQRCTSEPDLPTRFSQLLQELDAGDKAITLLNKQLSLDIWREIKNQWWFDEVYLCRDLTAVGSAFATLEAYTELDRPRGRGHVVERWVAAHYQSESFSQARKTLTVLSHSGDSR